MNALRCEYDNAQGGSKRVDRVAFQVGTNIARPLPRAHFCGSPSSVGSSFGDRFSLVLGVFFLKTENFESLSIFRSIILLGSVHVKNTACSVIVSIVFIGSPSKLLFLHELSSPQRGLNRRSCLTSKSGVRSD